MKNILLFILCFVFYGNSFSQFRYHFKTFPSDAKVYMNDKEVCTTPCETDFYWRDAENGKLVFSVQKKGFYSWSDTLTKKPRVFDFYYDTQLKRKYPQLDFDTLPPLLIFDKLAVTFKDGQELGYYKNKQNETTPITWEGSTKIGTEKVEELFYEISNNAGLNTPISEAARLFNENKKINPRFLVGVEIIDFKIDVTQKDDLYQTKIDIQFNWKVKDRATDKIVLDYKNTGSVKSKSNYFSIKDENFSVLEDAIIDFIKTDQFFELFNNTQHEKPLLSNTLGDQQKIILDSTETPVFKTFSKMIQYASKSCVTIETENGHGSGFFMDPSGLILTSHHVIDQANKIKIHLNGGVILDGEVMSSNESLDVALIKIPGSGYQALTLNSSPLQLGQDVSTIGTPTDIKLGQSLSKGVVSGRREVDGKIFTQLNMSVSPGNSGGPLINRNGEVVGIISSKLIGEGIEGIAFAVPTKKIVQALKISY